MKLNKWLYGAAALAMLAACSDSLDGPKDPNNGKPAEEGQGYIGINIQMPTVNGTRANDSFGDGELSEYVVDDAVLLLFQGTSEATATFTGAYTLDEGDPSYDNTNNQITRHSIRVAKVSGVGFDNNLYALVMVNGVKNGLYNLEDPDAEWMWTENVDSKGNKIGKNIREFQETIFTKVAASGKTTINKLFEQTIPGNDYASYIFMTNSPLSKVGGGSKTPGNNISAPLPVLVELNPEVYPNQSLAIANPAGIIHVERIVGKVTCSSFNKATELTVNIKGYDYELDVDSIWWDMAQDMADTYVVRNTNRNLPDTQATSANYKWRWDYASQYATGSNIYRMLGESSVRAKVKEAKSGTDSEGNATTTYVWNDTTFYRPYFCQVPGYNKPKVVKGDDGKTFENKVFTKDTMVYVKGKTVAWDMGNGSSAEGPGAFYPFENTFPVEYMKYANTTRIGFWVTFKFKGAAGAPAIPAGTNFYVRGMDKTTLYLDDDKGNDPLTNLAIAELSDTTKYKAMWAAVKAALPQRPETVTQETSFNIDNVDIGDLLKFKYRPTKDGKITIDSIYFKTFDEIDAYDKYHEKFTKAPTYTFAAAIRTTLNNLGTYYKYEGGKTFYEVRIKHFGDDNTPWDGDSKLQATTIDESYGKADDNKTRDRNYLGRYGIVRNNWYDLTVRVIKNLGHPKDPALWESNWHNKPDDNKDQYIAVELKVLSWAKRKQNVDF